VDGTPPTYGVTGRFLLNKSKPTELTRCENLLFKTENININRNIFEMFLDRDFITKEFVT
jgi:hypothetical protein